MTKKELTLNIIFFIPLSILNFLFYGLDGNIRFVKEIKKHLTNKAGMI